VAGIWGGTFHHFANRILRRHAARVGYGSNFTILDEDDARSVMRGCIADRRKAEPHFPKPEALLDVISLARNRDVPVEAEVIEHFGGLAVDPEGLRAAVRDYAAAKLRLNAMDFDDLLGQGLRLLETCPDLLARYQEQFLHVLVDEYQDTNPLQARWSTPSPGAIGICWWSATTFRASTRGAAPTTAISSRSPALPGCGGVQAGDELPQCAGILSVANACIAGNPEQFQKTLRAVREATLRPVRVDLRDGQQQARYIIQAVHALRCEGYRLGDMAVLYRSHFNAWNCSSS
jgi:DNA helicase-2/ATP-dependent DNA helicase PcrA